MCAHTTDEDGNFVVHLDVVIVVAELLNSIENIESDITPTNQENITSFGPSISAII